MKVNWRSVLAVILIVLAVAYNRQIGAALRSLRLGQMWEEFCAEVWRMPPLGRFAIVAMVLALLYVTIYVLLKNRGK